MGRQKYSEKDMCQCLSVLHKSDVDCSGFDCRLLWFACFTVLWGARLSCPTVMSLGCCNCHNELYSIPLVERDLSVMQYLKCEPWMPLHAGWYWYFPALYKYICIYIYIYVCVCVCVCVCRVMCISFTLATIQTVRTEICQKIIIICTVTQTETSEIWCALQNSKICWQLLQENK